MPRYNFEGLPLDEAEERVKQLRRAIQDRQSERQRQLSYIRKDEGELTALKEYIYLHPQGRLQSARQIVRQGPGKVIQQALWLINALSHQLNYELTREQQAAKDACDIWLKDSTNEVYEELGGDPENTPEDVVGWATKSP